jgi:hypothetical protein
VGRKWIDDLAELAEVAPGREAAIASAGQHDGPDLVVGLGASERVSKQVHHLRRQRIAMFRTVDGDPGDIAAGLVCHEIHGLSDLGRRLRHGPVDGRSNE